MCSYDIVSDMMLLLIPYSNHVLWIFSLDVFSLAVYRVDFWDRAPDGRQWTLNLEPTTKLLKQIRAHDNKNTNNLENISYTASWMTLPANLYALLTPPPNSRLLVSLPLHTTFTPLDVFVFLLAERRFQHSAIHAYSADSLYVISSTNWMAEPHFSRPPRIFSSITFRGDLSLSKLDPIWWGHENRRCVIRRRIDDRDDI